LISSYLSWSLMG